MLDRKEFDRLVGAMRFALPGLWRAQGERNAEFLQRIASLELQVAELTYRVDVLTRGVTGAVSASEKEAK